MALTSCCFTGHRYLPAKSIPGIEKRLDHEIDNLISQGVTDFLSGGALGFDQIAASLIIQKKQAGKKVRLIFALPCQNQDMHWTDTQKRLYRALLRKADEVIYVSELYYDGCMEKRNRYLVENASVCLCALLRRRGGTAQTVRIAREQGLQIINVAE